ncbi:pyrroloquinoline quinone biosynthesis peptide chaperone PqqD [Shewanella sp. GXUN23E]|uniref:pyrroloquinoline quinone biosynthesis peptide chaperone PqqD n=1 Tax=Shewanella sp. GXUN23E TaxID=3422498 RepID=UPI003D7D8A4F
MIQANQAYRIHKLFRLQYEPAQQAWVLLYPEGMIKLSDSASAILRMLNGERTVAELIAELQAQFPEADTLADDVTEFLGEAYGKKWIC